MSRNFFLHEKGICESKHVGEGTRVWANAHILPEARVGKHCNICEHVFIENKVVIGDHCTIKVGVSVWDHITLEDGVFVGPDVTFTNDLRPRAFFRRPEGHLIQTVIKRGATLGANSTILCGSTVGEFAMVGAHSLVTRDVPAHALVYGSPAKIVGRVCFCGEPLNEKDYCKACELDLKDNSEAKTIAKHGIKSPASP